MKLYDSPFSPFARKVRMVLELKGLVFDAIDGLDKDNHDGLARVNPRLEGRRSKTTAWQWSTLPISSPTWSTGIPTSPSIRPIREHVCGPARVGAAGGYGDRPDSHQHLLLELGRSRRYHAAGLLDAAQGDLSKTYARLDAELEGREFVCTTLTIADFAFFPHLVAVRSLEVPISAERQAHLSAWLQRMRELDVCRADLARARAYVADIRDRNIERERIFWRGDRIEWLLARGFHRWLMNEIERDRVSWPGFTASP